MPNILQDVRYGLRLLLKSPGFTALAVIALALGIGANTAVFSVAIAFLRKPVSLPNLDRLAMILSLPPQEPESLALSPQPTILIGKRRAVPSKKSQYGSTPTSV
jgi:hypothetical protein